MKSGRQQRWFRATVGAMVSVASVVATQVAQAIEEAADSGTPTPEEQSQVRDTITACRARFEQVDAQVDKAGVRDVGYYRVPGYPYMRSDRLLASFGSSELKELDPLGDWLHQLRDNEGFSRDVELQNLGIPLRERVTLLSELRLCAVWLSHFELGEAPVLERLVSLVQPPLERLDHGGQSRPAKSDLEKEIERRAELARKRFAVPVAELDSPGKLVLWKVKPLDPGKSAPSGDFAGAVRDSLGRVGLTEPHWELIASRFAPSLLIETAGEVDRIGTPRRGDQGPFVDVSMPVVDFQADYARMGSQSLIQFNYFIWFPGRAADDGSKAGNAKVDGLIWRVTLDANGKPLVYDTIHASGFDHLWFPLPALQARREALDDTVLTLQPEVPEQFVVRLGDGGHEVRRLVAADTVQATEVQQYELRRYEKLLTLPLPGGGTGSLFGPDGTIAGSAGAASPKGSLSGIGPIRQWGHHPMSLRADVYFDDPRLLERHFKAAPSLGTGKQAAEKDIRQGG